MKLHLLGVSGPFPESGGATSGYLLETGSALIQFDLGSGTLSRLTAKTAPESLSAIFLSHWHFDHAADLPVLMYRLEALKKTLPLYAPEDESSALFRMMRVSPVFDLHPLRPGDAVTLGDVSVTAVPARHPVPTLGYRIAGEGKTLGYTGATNTLPELKDVYRSCDLLLCDGLFPSLVWQEDKPHLSAALAAELARDAKCGRLVITHLNPLFSPQTLLEEARPVFRETCLAQAGKILSL